MSSPKNPDVMNFLQEMPHLQEAVWGSSPGQPSLEGLDLDNLPWPLDQEPPEAVPLLPQPVQTIPNVIVSNFPTKPKTHSIAGGSLQGLVRQIKSYLTVKEWFKGWRLRQVNAKYPRGTQYPPALLEDARKRAALLLKDDEFLTSWCKNLLTWDRPWGASFAATYLVNIAMCTSLNEIVMESGLDEAVDSIVEGDPLPETLIPEEDEEEVEDDAQEDLD